MSQLYARIFVQILDSSIAEDYELRHVFEDLLKLADYRTGVIDMTRQAIARRLNMPLEMINRNIKRLEEPDPASRDSDDEGRRLRRLDDHRDWGWSIVNWEKYDSMRTKADAAMRVARHRAKKDVRKASLPPICPKCSEISCECGSGGSEEVVSPEMERYNQIEARLCDMFKRPEGTVSSYAEQCGIAEVSRRPGVIDELAEIAVFQRKPGSYFPQSMSKLLGNWAETLDRARTHDARRQDQQGGGQFGKQQQQPQKTLLEKEVEKLKKQL